MNKVFIAKFCMECESICSFYDQGLSCKCDARWKTEVLDEEDYPDKWVDANITIEVLP